MTKMTARWEGPINGDLQHTAIVRDPDGTPAIIETSLEGLAAIASGLYALNATLTRLADAVDLSVTVQVNR